MVGHGAATFEPDVAPSVVPVPIDNLAPCAPQNHRYELLRGTHEEAHHIVQQPHGRNFVNVLSIASEFVFPKNGLERYGRINGLDRIWYGTI